MKIPFFGLDRQYSNIREEILNASDSVYRTGNVLDQAYTQFFENAIARKTQRKYSVAVNSCTQALIFALRILDHYSADRKDKVLLPTQSYPATLNAIIEAGYDPVFCDVDPVSGLIDINTIPVSPDEVSAILYVNLFGNVADYNKIKTWSAFFNQLEIPIIEDAAQSFGAKYYGVPSGKLGTISCLSFDPTKNLPNYGSGGMLLTDDFDYAQTCIDLRDNGKNSGYSIPGTNSKMSEADCAQMLVKLNYFDLWQARRKSIAEYYTEQLSTVVKLIPVDDNVEHAWHKFVIHTTNRSKLKEKLTQYGIETRIHYAMPLHLLDSVGHHHHRVLNGAEDFSRSCLSLPIYPELTDTEVEYIISTVIANVL